MDVIVVDLENQITFNKGEKQYIIEIGAAKVRNSKVISTFRRIVLPKTGHIRKSSRKMIGITEAEMRKGIPLAKAMKEFEKWIGEDDYYICTWSPSDLNILINNYSIDAYPISWLKNYTDIQKPISKVLGSHHPVSLKKALEFANIDHEGRLHSGLDDSINTANLFIKYENNIHLFENNINELLVCSLYKKCRDCGEIVYHTEFEKGKCKQCSSKVRKKVTL